MVRKQSTATQMGARYLVRGVFPLAIEIQRLVRIQRLHRSPLLAHTFAFPLLFVLFVLFTLSFAFSSFSALRQLRALVHERDRLDLLVAHALQLAVVPVLQAVLHAPPELVVAGQDRVAVRHGAHAHGQLRRGRVLGRIRRGQAVQDVALPGPLLARRELVERLQ